MFNAAERGSAMGLFALAPFLGPAIGPVVCLHVYNRMEAMGTLIVIGGWVPSDSFIMGMGGCAPRLLRLHPYYRRRRIPTRDLRACVT